MIVHMRSWESHFVQCGPALHINLHLIGSKHSGAVSSESFKVGNIDVLVYDGDCFLGSMEVGYGDGDVGISAIQ